MKDPLLTIKQVRDYLNGAVALSTLYDLVRAGKILVRTSALERMLNPPPPLSAPAPTHAPTRPAPRRRGRLPSILDL